MTITLLEYYAPVISIQVLRTRENPNTLQVLRTISVAPLTFNNVDMNSTKLVFEAAPLGSTSFVTDTGSAGGEWTTIFTLTNSEANLGGTYDSTSSWTIQAKLSDKFTASNPTIASTNVGTESVINACDKDGRFGVGKIPESGPAGSLDVAGNIYARGAPIGHYSSQVVTDFNDALTAGVYTITDTTINQPFELSEYGYLEIIVADGNTHNNSSNFIWQKYATTSGKVFERYKVNNGAWTAWKKVVMEDHPMLQEKPIKTITQGMPYGLNATLTRKDNLVTVTLNRRITNIDVFEYREMVETIPSGYRPTAEVHMVIVPNAGQVTKVPSILHFATDGKIRLTNGTAGQNVWTGTLTYITNDSYPS